MSENANMQAEEQHEGQVEGNEGQVEGNEGSQSDDSGGKKKQEEPTITESALKARLRRERKKWEDAAAEEARKAQMTAEEKAKEEARQADERASQREQAANQRLIKAEARTLAAELGIRADRVAAALKFADLSEVEVDDDGEPDAAMIRSALEPVTQQFPEWTKPEYGKAPGNTQTGGNVPRGMDAQIQEARDRGDFVTAERLHAQKLAQEGKLNH